jgi:hypothetical protein
MTSALGQPFSCIIPDVQEEQERLDREKEESAQEETEEDKQKTIEKGLELLEPLGVSCIRFFTSVSLNIHPLHRISPYQIIRLISIGLTNIATTNMFDSFM